MIEPIDIYAGRRWLGEVMPKPNGQFEARLPTGRSLGLYTTATAAAGALREEAKAEATR